MLTCTVFHAAASAVSGEMKTVGWSERVRIYPGGMLFLAKLDTGARNSSINAKNIREFERDGEPWVRFDVENRSKKSMTIELPQFREAKIKRHFGDRQHRPVVLMGICLDRYYRETQVTLVDREGFLYGLLIGRSYLKHKFVVDSSVQYTTQPECRLPDDDEK